MANVLGSSTTNAGKQAPPPPPLPAGMNVISSEGPRMQAPPPPPLPAGLRTVGAASNRQNAPTQCSKGMQAPPPPPLPNGMAPIMQQNAGMQAPPPPPPSLPAGMFSVTQSQAVMNDYSANASKPMSERSIKTGGRPTMSLADAMKNDELDNAPELNSIVPEAPMPEPVAKVNGGELHEGDYCFARSGMDGLYYRARIDTLDDNGVTLTFFDETVEHIVFEKVYTEEEAFRAMQCFANWGNKGNYYPAKVIDCVENDYTVTYDEIPDMQDTLNRSLVRFAPW